MTHPDRAALSVLAILRAIVSVLVISAALLAVEAMLCEAAGAALVLLVLPASVGVMTIERAVVLCMLANACQPAGGLLGVTCTHHCEPSRSGPADRPEDHLANTV